MDAELPYNLAEITLEELKTVISKFKKRKAPGPDEVPMEVFKEMDDDNLVSILDLLSQWWTAGAMPPETLQARIVMIYKKGTQVKWRITNLYLC
jgi:hypothetical protein